jgi:hypothetical protein
VLTIHSNPALSSRDIEEGRAEGQRPGLMLRAEEMKKYEAGRGAPGLLLEFHAPNQVQANWLGWYLAGCIRSVPHDGRPRTAGERTCCGPSSTLD